MKKRPVIGLIAGISGEILTQKLHAYGLDVALVVGKEGESGSHIADDVCVADMRNIADITEFFVQKKVQYVVIGTGHLLVLELARYLEQKGIVVSINVESSLLAKDKVLYKEKMLSCGIATPNFVLISGSSEVDRKSILQKISLPCVVKSPIDTVLPQKVNTEEELYNAMALVAKTKNAILVEEYIEGIDVTVPVLVEKNAVEALLLSYYNKSKECHLKGFSSNKKIVTLNVDAENSVKKFCKHVASVTGMEGLCRIDAIIDSYGKVYVLEANSVMVTGINEKQIEYGKQFLEKEGIDFANILVEYALNKFAISYTSLA